MINLFCLFGFHKMSKRYLGLTGTEFLCVRGDCMKRVMGSDGYYPTNCDKVLIYLFVLGFASPILWGTYECVRTVALFF